MAPRSSRRSTARTTKQSTLSQKPTRTFTTTAVTRNLGQSPSDLKQLIENRREFPHSASLASLVRLDWPRRQELFPHGPGVTKPERFGFKGRAYDVESLEPGATGNKFVYLYPEKRYYVVPIHEEGQSPDAPHRFLLVRRREVREGPGPHIGVIEPPEPSGEPFAHLHIIAGEDDSAIAEPVPHTAGIVEAILTATDSSLSTTPQAKQPAVASQVFSEPVPQSEQLIMQRLVWPPTEPLLVIDAPAGMKGLMPDFLSIRQLSVQNRLYDVKPLVGNEAVQLRLRQKYWITPLEDAPHGELALVREQSQPDQTEQFVVVSEPTQRRVWIDKAEALKDSGHLHIIGAEREWTTHDFSLAHLDMTEPRIIGIIEAVLVPEPEAISPQITTEPVLPEPQIIKLASGKTRWMYRNFDGQFISKARYEALKGKRLGQPPKPRKRAASFSIPPSPIEPTPAYPNRIEMIAPDLLRMTIESPSLIPVREFLERYTSQTGIY